MIINVVTVKIIMINHASMIINVVTCIELRRKKVRTARGFQNVDNLKENNIYKMIKDFGTIQTTLSRAWII